MYIYSLFTLNFMQTSETEIHWPYNNTERRYCYSQMLSQHFCLFIVFTMKVHLYLVCRQTSPNVYLTVHPCLPCTIKQSMVCLELHWLPTRVDTCQCLRRNHSHGVNTGNFLRQEMALLVLLHTHCRAGV